MFSLVKAYVDTDANIDLEFPAALLSMRAQCLPVDRLAVLQSLPCGRELAGESRSKLKSIYYHI